MNLQPEILVPKLASFGKDYAKGFISATLSENNKSSLQSTKALMTHCLTSSPVGVVEYTTQGWARDNSK